MVFSQPKHTHIFFTGKAQVSLKNACFSAKSALLEANISAEKVLVFFFFFRAGKNRENAHFCSVLPVFYSIFAVSVIRPV